MRYRKARLRLIQSGGIVQGMFPLEIMFAVDATRRAARGARATDPRVPVRDRANRRSSRERARPRTARRPVTESA
jgi:hypothetical protein